MFAKRENSIKQRCLPMQWIGALFDELDGNRVLETGFGEQKQLTQLSGYENEHFTLDDRDKITQLQCTLQIVVS